MRVLPIALATIFSIVSPAHAATTYVIGDDDGYGVGVPNGQNHPFLGIPPYDNRSAAEMAATDGAQFTDTYSTTQPGYSPQSGTIATFIFSGLTGVWTQGAMTFDLADFQASTFGSTIVTYNGIVQDWAFNDGYPRTAIHSFNFDQDVLDTINTLGSLTVSIDRNNSTDFYGFDFAKLTDFRISDPAGVPEPATWLMMIAGFAMVGSVLRRHAPPVPYQSR